MFKKINSLKGALRALPVVGALVASSAMAVPHTAYTYRVYLGGIHAASKLAFQTAVGDALPALAFPTTPIGSTSAPVAATLKNTSKSTLTLGSPAFIASAPFAVQSTNCGSSLASGSSCTAQVTFSPAANQIYLGDSTFLTVNSPDGGTLPLTGYASAGNVSRVVSGPLNVATFIQRTDGTWVVSGQNTYGELGIGNTTNQTAFVAVPSLAGVTDIVTGVNHTFARKADGTWLASGRNSEGQLGNGTAVNLSTFTPIANLAGASKVVVGAFFSFAQFADGSWKGAGSSAYGQLGVGISGGVASFTNIPALAGASQVIAGDYTTYAKMSTGAWKSIGYNVWGQLGNGNATNQSTWQSLPALDTATQVLMGQDHILAQLADGTWVGAGHNSYGPLGIGTSNSVNSTFVPVPGLTGATQVLVGGINTLAQFPDGTWMGAGSSSYGQMGLGNTTQQNNFVPMPWLTGATQVIAYDYVNFAKRSDGVWVAAGDGAYGQLGPHTANTNSTPIPVFTEIQ